MSIYSATHLPRVCLGVCLKLHRRSVPGMYHITRRNRKMLIPTQPTGNCFLRFRSRQFQRPETRVYCRLCSVADMRLQSYSEWIPQPRTPPSPDWLQADIPVSGPGLSKFRSYNPLFAPLSGLLLKLSQQYPTCWLQEVKRCLLSRTCRQDFVFP